MEKRQRLQKCHNLRRQSFKYHLPFCTCNDIISMRTKMFEWRWYICEETAVRQREKY